MNIAELKGVGNAKLELLNKLGLRTVDDLLYHFPRRYEDYSQLSTISQLQPGLVTIKVRIDSINGRYVRRGLHITEAVVSDATGKLRVTWFNQPYRARQMRTGVDYYMSGEYEFNAGRYSITNPASEKASDFPKNTARIVPIYKETKGLKSHSIRKLLANVFQTRFEPEDHVPKDVISRAGLLSLKQALKEIHFPSSSERLNEAKFRLGFDELFELSIASQLNRRDIESDDGFKIVFQKNVADSFVSSLPFELTNGQRKAAWQVLQDLEQSKPMNRLLEGDVGSGKTIVAAMAAAMAIANKYQVAYMAPTEILARQQREVLSELLKPFGSRVELLIGSMKAAEKERLKDDTLDGTINVVVGTHALIQETTSFNKLGLIVVDEQHRFGVKQRKKLQEKAVTMPHVLTMTATPIPRSMALVVYGELDLSIIDEMPKSRLPIKTSIHSGSARNTVYKKIDQQIEEGRQVFVVCPLISESDTLGVKSVEEEYERLKKGPFKHRNIALLHGKLKPDEKAEIMESLNDGTTDIVVSTTVVEVGVDLPNATVMLIEGAERFGLAQLHQLRGRVGRAGHQAYCFLIPSGNIQPTQRLRALESTNSGFRLAEIDLQLRGPGAIYGERQSGMLDLRMANLGDARLIKTAREAAKSVVESDPELLQYPRLAKKVDNLRRITNLN